MIGFFLIFEASAILGLYFVTTSTTSVLTVSILTGSVFFVVFFCAKVFKITEKNKNIRKPFFINLIFRSYRIISLGFVFFYSS